MTSIIPCIFCGANLGTCPPEWMVGQYFSSVPIGLSTGVPLIYVSPNTQAAPSCPGCIVAINTYNIYGSLSGVDISYDLKQITLAINAVRAINSLAPVPMTRLIQDDTFPPSNPILIRTDRSASPLGDKPSTWW